MHFLRLLLKNIASVIHFNIEAKILLVSFNVQPDCPYVNICYCALLVATAILVLTWSYQKQGGTDYVK